MTRYQADCALCGGVGGWVEVACDCIPVESCALCGNEFDTTERLPDELAINGVMRPVCRPCMGKEPE